MSEPLTQIAMLQQQHHDGHFYRIGDKVQVGDGGITEKLAAAWIADNRAMRVKDTEPVLTAEERAQAISDVLRVVPVGRQGKPTVSVVTEKVGFKVTGAEIDELWPAISTERDSAS